MISSELFNDIKAKPVVLVDAIALHFVLIILLGVNLSSSEIHKPASSGKKTVKAVVVDAAKIEAEAKKLNIPIFAMVDTNSDPRDVDYVIPANDDASKSINKVVSYVADSIVEGLSERKAGKDSKEESPAEDKPKKAAKAKKPELETEVPSTEPEDKKAMKEAKEDVKLESKKETLAKSSNEGEEE